MSKKPKTVKVGTNLIIDNSPKDRSESPVVIYEEVGDYKEKDTTNFNKQIEEEQELKDKLPIDKLIDIATKQGLLEDLTPDQKFARFVKGIKLHDIVKDCMQSSLNEYAKQYNKINPTDNLQLKLILRNNKNPRKGESFAADLLLEVRRGDTYKIMIKKSVGFTHVRDVRDEAAWKYALYGAMYNELITLSLNHLLLTDDVNSGRIKPTIS
jgi:hypothetical protein